jgi:hypothetical protein
MNRQNSRPNPYGKTYSDEQFAATANKMRSWLYSIARKRVNGVVTADDAHTYLDRQGIRPTQFLTRLSFINSVLRSSNFVYAGETQSKRPVAKGRVITEWSRM